MSTDISPASYPWVLNQEILIFITTELSNKIIDKSHGSDDGGKLIELALKKVSESSKSGESLGVWLTENYENEKNKLINCDLSKSASDMGEEIITLPLETESKQEIEDIHYMII